jgi:hypothetical protein
MTLKQPSPADFEPAELAGYGVSVLFKPTQARYMFTPGTATNPGQRFQPARPVVQGKSPQQMDGPTRNDGFAEDIDPTLNQAKLVKYQRKLARPDAGGNKLLEPGEGASPGKGDIGYSGVD